MFASYYHFCLTPQQFLTFLATSDFDDGASNHRTNEADLSLHLPVVSLVRLNRHKYDIYRVSPKSENVRYFRLDCRMQSSAFFRNPLSNALPVW